MRYPLTTMNRQLRRAQEKADEKQQKEKVRAKKAKRVKKEDRREKRAASKSAARKSAKEGGQPRRRPDLFYRFAGVVTMFTTVFIILQALAPRPEETVTSFSLIVEVAYYFIFGYALTMWLSKRGVGRALPVAIATGVALAAGLQAALLVVPVVAPDLPTAALLAPDWTLFLLGSVLAVLGAFAGQWVAGRMSGGA